MCEAVLRVERRGLGLVADAATRPSWLSRDVS